MDHQGAAARKLYSTKRGRLGCVNSPLRLEGDKNGDHTDLSLLAEYCICNPSTVAPLHWGPMIHFLLPLTSSLDAATGHTRGKALSRAAGVSLAACVAWLGRANHKMRRELLFVARV